MANKFNVGDKVYYFNNMKLVKNIITDLYHNSVIVGCVNERLISAANIFHSKAEAIDAMQHELNKLKEDKG